MFSAGSTSFAWADLVVAGWMWRDWPELVEATRGGAALEASAPEGTPAAGSIDSALRAWRRDRGLIAASEMRAWLAARGLRVPDVRGHLRRRALRERAAATGSAGPIEGLDRLVVVDALCAGTARAVAQRLAECAAAAGATGAAAGARVDLGDRGPAALAAGRELGIPPRAARARGERVTALEQALEALRRQLLTPEALAKELDSRRLDWLAIEARRVLFERDSVAREAALRVRADGVPLEHAAADAHATVEQVRRTLDDIGEPMGALLLSASPGELIGPEEVAGRFELWQLDAKASPTVDDPRARARAEEAIVTRELAREVEARVSWHADL